MPLAVNPEAAILEYGNAAASQFAKDYRDTGKWTYVMQSEVPLDSQQGVVQEFREKPPLTSLG